MARHPRLEVPGIPLHVIQRGNNRGLCFLADADRSLYLLCMREASYRHQCAIHAYVLMPNHVHLLVTPQATGGVAAMMQDVGRRYVRIFNDEHGRTGTLWEGRYKSSLIDTETYLMTCHRYIELNPVRAGLIADPGSYRWSSHRHYAFGLDDPQISKHPIFDRLGDNPTSRCCAFRALFREPIEAESIERIRLTTNQGWALGSDVFLDQVERISGQIVRPPKRGRPFKQEDANGASADGSSEMLI
jgi:putative transposase